MQGESTRPTTVPASADSAPKSRRFKSLILDDALPGQEAATTAALSEAARDGGEDLAPIKAADLIDHPDALADARLLVLPSARSVPLAAIPAVDRFLRAGGRLLAGGLPLGHFNVFRAGASGGGGAGGSWITQAQYNEAAANLTAKNMLATFGGDDLKNWRRATDSSVPTMIDDVDGVLHVKMSQLSGWDTFVTQFDHPFPPGHTMTCFRAKGDVHTRLLAVEWQEEDGSRWIATVPLNADWSPYALPPEAFQPWEPPKGRGGPQDRLNVAKARRFSVGLAFSHTDVDRGPHEYWFDDLGTAPPPFEIDAARAKPPHIEALCPAYQFYPVRGPVRLRTDSEQRIVAPAEIEAPAILTALHPRPGGAGFDKNRPWRWQPLIEAVAPKNNDYRGAIAVLVTGLEGPYRGSAWAAFTPGEGTFYTRPAVRQIITDTIRALGRGVLLSEAGSTFFTQPPDQPMQLGARVTSFSTTDSASDERFSIRLTVGPRNAQPQYQKEWEFGANEPDVVRQDKWSPPSWPDKGLVVTTELRQQDQVIDRLSHEVFAYRPKDKPEFVTIKDGGFVNKGKPWRINGVNYMPSSGIGRSLEENELFEHWIGAAAYDPVVVDRDLHRVAALGLNAVSAFIYHDSLAAGNLPDFLRRCDLLNLKVNLALRPGTPIEFEPEQWKAIIEQSKLAQNDAVFAYDLAWEWTHWSRAYQQKYYTTAWRAWVNKQYGSVDAAEKAWGVAAPRDDKHELDVPTSDQLFTDGEWRKLAADYRAFLDQFIAEKYSKARELVRSVDPNHAVSFRMNTAGDPTAQDRENLAYDFYGLRGPAVDFYAPEAYGRIGDYERVKVGRFTVSYAHLCDPAKPVVWAEAGVTVWDNVTNNPRADRLDFQANFYRAFYRMMRESGSDGVFWWWYPGGFRTNERSDFGLINPDGTDRPVTKVIREEGPTFLNAPKPPAPNVTIEIDRDKDARGLIGVYESVKEQYWKAIDEKKQPGLTWKQEPQGAQ